VRDGKRERQCDQHSGLDLDGKRAGKERRRQIEPDRNRNERPKGRRDTGFAGTTV